MSKKGIRKKHFSIVFRCKLVGSISKESGDLMGQEVLKDEVSTPMRCIAPMDVVSKAELRSENTH